MALTATAQSALPREPIWDEVIVPALRKRLKDESTVLTKRMSAASVTSSEDQAISQYHPRPGTSTSSHSHSNSKPSAIPRPSIQSSRTTESSAGVYAGAPPPSFQRARALSQPFPFEPPLHADQAPPVAETRSISPINAPKGTRIPVSRTRTGSTSSQAQSTYTSSGTTGRVNGYARHNGDASESQLYRVEEKTHPPAQSPPQSHTSRSTIQVPRRKVSDIFQEQAPFPNSLSSSHSQLDYAPERMSSESDERPFEHWYRGDVARNGGVGELRVARRQEMLDIANYGHTLRNAASKSQSGASSRSRSNSRGRDMPNGRAKGRPRADSVGARESIYIDEDAMEDGDAVMDERPLTDLDDDDDDYQGYEDQLDDYYTQTVQPHTNGSVSSPSLERSDTPTSRLTQNTTRSRIPQPTSRSRTTTPTPTLGKPTRSVSENALSGPSSPSVPSMQRSATQPLKTQGSPSPSSLPANPSAPSTPTAKKRAKSPASSTPSTSKKQKAKAPPSSMQKRPGAKDENRRSVGQYPLPDGDEHAIPTWTQPRQANGNWDEVVLPVVARKKGLQDQYETADGTPKPREPEPMVVEPAPGTFGYDPTKRRKRWSGNPAQILMDEFGQPKEFDPPEPQPLPRLEVPEPSPDEQRGSPTTPISSSPRSFERPRVVSPPPFSHYQTAQHLSPQMQTIRPMPPASKEELIQPPADEDGGAGCCKCLVM
ncbi:hypothetical protein GSI_02953 [Ganoderma sinense ZZ0214-1]|uniref:Uncharacterized protein n=1 Tax=Ganoderma sinense ZZ0214-1 TaxID=1077348 RepID=A0A2G8SN22_9APHY|nr:hypothetical protein GSI_02953 [Ganoderma sinense ZZ0214-1]